MVLQHLYDDGVNLVRKGAALCDSGEFRKAIETLNQAAAINPGNAFAFLYRGYAYLMTDNMQAMGEDLNRAQQLDPNNAEIHYRIGMMMRMRLYYSYAIQSFTLATQCKPDFEAAWILLADSHYRFGATDMALATYEKAQQAFPGNASIPMEQAYMLPSVPMSGEEIDASRAAFKQNLDQLIKEKFTLSAPESTVIYFPFYHAYQGREVKSMLEKLAEFFYKSCPGLAYTAPHMLLPHVPKKKIRIGFILCLRFKVILTNFWRPILQQLAASGEFDVWLIISDSSPENPALKEITADIPHSMVLPANLGESREMIARERFDILAYFEIGMSSQPYFLAMSRLAPIQCNMTGHPMTSGLATMDYYFSAAALEPENAPEHYTEKLVLFDNNLAVFHRPPMLENIMSREQLGLPEDKHLYCCPVMLFKLHPDMDSIFARILERDTKAIIVLFDSQFQTLWRSSLLKRFANNMTLQQLARVVFLPHADKDLFIQLLHTMDAILDSFHFSFGTTSFITLGANLPFVTWPGEFMRGRGAYALYRRMGITDLIADTHEEFIELAVKLANDKTFRAKITEKIRNNSDVIFDDYEIIDQFAARLKGLYASHHHSLTE